jgi:hypothetical protein
MKVPKVIIRLIGRDRRNHNDLVDIQRWPLNWRRHRLKPLAVRIQEPNYSTSSVYRCGGMREQ